MKRTVKRFIVVFVITVGAILATVPIAAHVALDSPNGGQQLSAGAITEIHWHVVIAHNQLDWDLEYSVSGDTGPWIPIAENLPLGDGSNGAVHSYDWLVPDTPSEEVRIRVIQDNAGTDYTDVSDADLAIVQSLFSDGFETAATSQWTSVTP